MELVDLKNWWFNNSNIWFNSNKYNDINIANTYEHLIKIEYDYNIIIENKEYGIGYIILYDQIIRHITRARNYENTYIFNNFNKLLKFVKIFYNKYKNYLFGYEFCFVLLPLRHSNIFKKQVFVINETWNKIENLNNQELIKIYRNYIKASYERISDGNIYLTSKILNYNIQDNIEKFINDFKDILDITCHHYNNDTIFDFNSANILKIINSCIKLKENKIKNFILSISGGVDSMILSYILKKLEINFKMIHINYYNRIEICEKEKEFLCHWANYLEIDLYIRDIYEINRSKCMNLELRNLYENYTRDVRYQSYIDISNNNSNCAILLGHNHDDCIENILTNITNKNKYENLYGMEWENKIKYKNQDIIFIRPLLNISKLEIYNFAHSLNIPYLFDSTPSWSQRGMIRDIVKPTLLKWNKSSIDGLDELSKVIKESYECVDLLVDNWLNKLKLYDSFDNDMVNIYKIKSKDQCTTFKIIKLNLCELNLNKIFWSRLLEKINLNISLKNLNIVINRFETIKNKFNSIQIKQIKQIQINKNKKIYFWKINDTQIIIGFD
jgi:tRNA(Ile)-lysidine synthetase-like protein